MNSAMKLFRQCVSCFYGYISAVIVNHFHKSYSGHFCKQHYCNKPSSNCWRPALLLQGSSFPSTASYQMDPVLSQSPLEDPQEQQIHSKKKRPTCCCKHSRLDQN
ncbi:hypothetical protein AMECASPLE_012951 [Ameca splendens]|uniref:Uncharacterized protein n=1 Tax=Ameca splendens TaxID=208324 RepID=A0ABV0Z011_9TELE